MLTASSHLYSKEHDLEYERSTTPWLRLLKVYTTDLDYTLSHRILVHIVYRLLHRILQI